MNFIGIDPGKHGAIAWLDEGRKTVHVEDCPLNGDDFDYRGMRALVELAGGAGGAVVTMEEVHAFPSDGRCSAFAFGRAFEAWIAVLALASMKPRLVMPRAWKRIMLAGIPNDKKAEAMALKQRMQGTGVESMIHGPRGGIRDGRVDALLLAEYGRVIWRSGGRR